mmetsp:Transcript_17185/g.36891  ORF Transcript_17185/g.36891 Transcript_17185/m.36891 type:complete len:208 (-) Transcript_17185:478-1101(-)
MRRRSSSARAALTPARARCRACHPLCSRSATSSTLPFSGREAASQLRVLQPARDRVLWRSCARRRPTSGAATSPRSTCSLTAHLPPKMLCATPRVAQRPQRSQAWRGRCVSHTRRERSAFSCSCRQVQRRQLTERRGDRPRPAAVSAPRGRLNRQARSPLSRQGSRSWCASEVLGNSNFICGWDLHMIADDMKHLHGVGDHLVPAVQ